MREVPFDPELIDDPWIFDTIPGFEAEDQLPAELVERIKAAVEELPEVERSVVECVVWGQMSKVEVGETLGRSRQSVHDVLKRGIAKLQAALADLEGL